MGPRKRPTLEPDPDASRIVKRIFDMAEAGHGMVNIARVLNDEGIASSRGKLWGKTSVHAILRNVVYTGTLVWGANAKDKAEPVRVEKAFPAIISKAQFGRVGKLMRSRAPKRSHPRRFGSTYLLSGLVKCKALLAETILMLHQKVSVGIARDREAQPLVERHRPSVHFQHLKSYRQAQIIPLVHGH